jgi:tRNA(fMet)-specific endonuclease VapC
VVSAVMRRAPHVIARLAAQARADVGVPQPAFAEIAYGLERLPASRRKQELRDRFDEVRRELRPIPWSDGVSDAFGTIKAALERRGARLEDLDVAIAAHAVAAGATLVTANVKHMSRIPGLVLDDWT